MIRYKKYQNKNEKNVTTFNKWYARAVCEETVDIAALAEHMSTHNTPFSTGAIHGMLKDMVNCIKEGDPGRWRERFREPGRDLGN